MSPQSAPGQHRGVHGALSPSSVQVLGRGQGEQSSLSQASECPEGGIGKIPGGWHFRVSLAGVLGASKDGRHHWSVTLEKPCFSDCHLLPWSDHEPSPHHWVSIQSQKLDRQTSLFPEPLCLPLETFKLSSFDPPGSAKSAESRTENQRKHEQSSAFEGGGLGAVWGRGVGASG